MTIIYSFVDGYLIGLHILAIMNKVAMKWWTSLFRVRCSVLGYMARNGIAGLYGGFIFIFVRIPHTDFYSAFWATESSGFPFHTSSPAFIVSSLVDLYSSD